MLNNKSVCGSARVSSVGCLLSSNEQVENLKNSTEKDEFSPFGKKQLCCRIPFCVVVACDDYRSYFATDLRVLPHSRLKIYYEHSLSFNFKSLRFKCNLNYRLERFFGKLVEMFRASLPSETEYS